MDLLITSDEHFRYLNECVLAEPSSALICSYGLWAGILNDGRDTREWGPRFQSQTRELLEKMRAIKKVKLLIGVYEYKSCKNKIPCADCERKYALDLIRHMNHAEKFPEFDWRVATSSHIKCILFNYEDGSKKGIAGSRNFTDSSWEDISVSLGDGEIGKLEKYLANVWDAARPLSDDTVSAILLEQGISEEAVQLIGT